MELKSLQHAFQAYLMGEASTISQEIRGKGKEFIAQRLSIYEEGYYLRLEEVLAADYPTLKELLGEECFFELCKNYIHNYPSRHPLIRFAGQSLAEFLLNSPMYSNKPYLSELANFEWLLGNTIDAADAVSMNSETFAKIPLTQWDNLKIEFHPSLATSQLCWNIPEYWLAVNDNLEIPPFRKEAKPVCQCYWRQDLESYFEALSPPEAWALEAFRQHKALGEVCEGLVKFLSEDEAIHFCADLLQKWLNRQWIVQANTFQ